MALTATVTAGKRFQQGEKVSSGKLNQLGLPGVDISGTVAPSDLSDTDFSGNLAPGAYFYGVDSGVANAAVVRVSFPIPGYTDGMVIVFRCMAANTGSCTLQLQTDTGPGTAVTNTFPAAPVVAGQPGQALQNGNWVPGQMVECRYRLDGDLIQDQEYSNTGSLVIPVVAGFTYTWTKGTNDTSLTYTGSAGAVVLAASGTFTPVTGSVTLAGTDNVFSGGTLVAASAYWQMMVTPPDPVVGLLKALRFQ